MKIVKMYTDGSSLGNPGASGWCALLEYNGNYEQISGGERYSTNGRMELKAVVEGLKILKESCKIIIHSDSKYVCDSIEKYLQNWLNKGFKDVKHPDLWIEYNELAQQHEIEVQWIKAHSGIRENEHCDKVAKANAHSFTKN